jgi:hypothetical protein
MLQNVKFSLAFDLFLRIKGQVWMVMHTYNSHTQEAETEGWKIPDQSGLHSKNSISKKARKTKGN